MPDADQDVKKDSEASAESEEELDEEELEAEEETEESEETEEEEDFDAEADDKKDDSESEESDKKEEVDYKALFEKEAEKNKNLNLALQEKRAKGRDSSVVQPKADPNARVLIDPATIGSEIVKRNEADALVEIYKEFPELAPENDANNVLYDALVKDMAIGVQVTGKVPIYKEDFVELARKAMHFRKGETKDVEKAKAEGRAEAHKEQLKRESADLGGTSKSRAGQNEDGITEKDRVIARKVGMDPKRFVKVKDYYDTQEYI